MKIAFVLCIYIVRCTALHLKGTWRTDDVFFKFLTRFGFQQTNAVDISSTQGYIYGNITLLSGTAAPKLTLAVVDSEYFLDLYENRLTQPAAKACPAMFRRIDSKVWDEKCRFVNSTESEDFLRRIPCPRSRLCEDENKPRLVVPGYQFTFRIQDMTQPRFWYVSLVACSRNASTDGHCTWTTASGATEVAYDIWLVNGSPLRWRHANPFEHQFTFEQHDIVEAFAAFALLYTLLVPVQLCALLRQRHPLVTLLTVGMCLEYAGVLLNLLHVTVFASDGHGIPATRTVAQLVDNGAQSLFMLLLLLVVKGWTITRPSLPWRSAAVLLTLWASYSVANMALFIWNQMEVDERSGVGEWQTLPGRLILAFRLALMGWFVLELRETFLLEHGMRKVRFYLHFGAGFLVWFVYLPLAALVCSLISPLWTYKTMLSITYAADFISYCVMTHLFWPSRGSQYFSLRTGVSTPAAQYSDVGESSLSSSEEEQNVIDVLEMRQLKSVERDHARQNGVAGERRPAASPPVSPARQTVSRPPAVQRGEADLGVTSAATGTLLVEVDLERDRNALKAPP